MEHATNYNRWIVSLFAPYIGETVMEVGIGHGGFNDLLKPLAKRYVGVDIDSRLVEQARVKNLGASYIVADVTDAGLRQRVAGAGIDTVLCCNVLEHIPEDGAAVKQLVSILPTGGHLLLYVPAFPGLYTALDRLAGHCRRYTRKSLAALVPDSAAEILRLDYVNPIGGLGWWLNGKVPHHSLDSSAVNGQIAVFDKYVLPFSRLLTPLFRHVFGQSLICVIRRR
jgi:SAM-dependent methyltransferase